MIWSDPQPSGTTHSLPRYIVRHRICQGSKHTGRALGASEPPIGPCAVPRGTTDTHPRAVKRLRATAEPMSGGRRRHGSSESRPHSSPFRYRFSSRRDRSAAYRESSKV
ncbi:hypothetical protein MLP_00130 [Microlunatus phosphovorus NM-1]|uniref:Uncharacterized protein n=1 Tax=Microlunatus phosphovorus (strain ATCC 700054 / DSM 10555 / JCM 9379 / NBRC 101784 / NCIMB 13414 / VKM Ac-1990 / NM-1) TaxID=1032480 RepID=F5XGC0_MICPN|nr:hypothetical protein MLP_00130 [Microlunatus phosphovorus NM-1]